MEERGGLDAGHYSRASISQMLVIHHVVTNVPNGAYFLILAYDFTCAGIAQPWRRRPAVISPVHDLAFGHGLLARGEQPLDLDRSHFYQRHPDRSQNANGEAEAHGCVGILGTTRYLDEDHVWLVSVKEDVQRLVQFLPSGQVLAGLAHFAVLAPAFGRDEQHGGWLESPGLFVQEEATSHHAEVGERWVKAHYFHDGPFSICEPWARTRTRFLPSA